MLEFQVFKNAFTFQSFARVLQMKFSILRIPQGSLDNYALTFSYVCIQITITFIIQFETHFKYEYLMHSYDIKEKIFFGCST